eukprot:GILI01014138.1.p1 GENE.GILI01014138.1~~GILI01014138.1.p1  ORF type:complete len:153 (+),score=30.01 GILI01014138.1:87-545(+)
MRFFRTSCLFLSLLFVLMASSVSQAARQGVKNVLGSELQSCCTSPLTGYYRDGFCSTGPTDHGRHTVCAQVTDAFLQFSRSKGNDLITPKPQYNFPGLKHGDKWCLCVGRWREAYEAGVAPPVVLEATNQKALEVVTLDMLKEHAVSLASDL